MSCPVASLPCNSVSVVPVWRRSTFGIAGLPSVKICKMLVKQCHAYPSTAGHQDDSAGIMRGSLSGSRGFPSRECDHFVVQNAPHVGRGTKTECSAISAEITHTVLRNQGGLPVVWLDCRKHPLPGQREDR